MAKKKEVKKVVESKFKSGVDDRLKAIQNIKVPDQNTFKMENESTIDNFLRYGLNRRDEKETRKAYNRKKNSR